MANLPEYSIRYRYTGQPNTQSGYRVVGSGSFAASGNTDVAIGMITRIEYRHAHTSSRYATWATQGALHIGGGTIQSDVDTREIRGDVRTYYNTFTGNMPTPAQWAAGWQIETLAWRTAGSSTASLYWRADASDPMDIIVYFHAARDMVDGASAPTNLTVSYGEGGVNYRSTYGSYVQDWSRPVITCGCTLDPAYPYLEAQHTLTLWQTVSGNTNTIYSVTQLEDGEFNVGVIHTSGTINYRYTVTDTAGNTANRTGTFTVLAYTPPQLSGVTVERYSAGMTDQGGATYNADDAGELLRVSLTATTKAVANKNAWTLVCEIGIRGGSTHTIQIASGANGSTYTVSANTAAGRNVLSGAYSAANTYDIRFVLTDAFGATSAQERTVYKAGAIINIERYGVAVGMRSTGTANDKRFEVAASHTAHFFGGIDGVNVYRTNEVDTGGRWIDGRPIYRRIFEGGWVSEDQRIDLGAVANVGSVIHVFGTSMAGDGSYIRPIPWNYDSPNGNYQAINAAYSPSAGVFRMWSMGVSIASFIVAIEYTKTTDSGVPYVDEPGTMPASSALGVGRLGEFILG